MTVMEVIGVLGIGSILGIIVSKLFDILWLQKIVLKNEGIRWLRDQRLKTFKEVSREFSTLGLTKSKKEILEIAALASEVSLLINDKALRGKIKKFVNDLFDLLNSPGSQVNENHEIELKRLSTEAEAITDELRNIILNGLLDKA